LPDHSRESQRKKEDTKAYNMKEKEKGRKESSHPGPQ